MVKNNLTNKKLDIYFIDITEIEGISYIYYHNLRYFTLLLINYFKTNRLKEKNIVEA